ncbi:helix-turn-helix domain-containing protein [Microbispora bryophytorum]|uniref:helix-turn-helix domain-containing protein n=1 Tax=Microbispora bryophytorum TaxID=1460882 RepID=UPI00115C4347|nr:helix-turn-helix transcriptional regulator [Microbispora bryophytorum]TQS06926.1 helix-turn-helix domain-containing protein [Microbispora bryophytorum]
MVNKGANDLGGFLRSRRERLTPDAAGIEPCATRRRVPGLRREELAELAGVSIGYYTRLEQGVSGSASGAVIDALAAALQLSPAEHEHLRILAAPRRPTRPRARRSKLSPSVRGLLAAMPGTPAIVIDHRADVLAWNRLGHAPPVMLGGAWPGSIFLLCGAGPDRSGRRRGIPGPRGASACPDPVRPR